MHMCQRFLVAHVLVAHYPFIGTVDVVVDVRFTVGVEVVRSRIEI